MSKRYVVVDLETTGNSWKDGKDKITQIAAVVVEDGEILEIFSSFVNPKREIPPFITELTGIDESLVKQAPLFQDVAPMIVELLQGAAFVAHNVHFDWNFLNEELRQSLDIQKYIVRKSTRLNWLKFFCRQPIVINYVI